MTATITTQARPGTLGRACPVPPPRKRDTMDLPRVVGADTSLTATGLAWPHGEVITHGRAGLTAFTTDPGTRAHNLGDLAGELHARILNGPAGFDGRLPQLVVLEGIPTSGTKVDSERCYLWWRLVELLHETDTPVLVVPPTTLKLYATSFGSANKREVIAACNQLLPQWETRKTGKRGNVLDTPDDNKVDAVWLMAIGCHLLGHPLVAVTPYRERALEKLTLPPGIRMS